MAVSRQFDCRAEASRTVSNSVADGIENETGPLARIKGVWRYQILLSSPQRAALRKAVEAMMVGKKFRGVDVAIYVDPITML